jgi:hypothetical protein
MAVKNNDATTESDLLKEQVPTSVTPSWVNIPAFESLHTKTDKVELVIFCWALLLYRRNYSADVHFTWKSRDREGQTYSAYDMRTEDMHWDKNDLLSVVLQKTQAFIRENLGLEDLADRKNCTFLLNDEYAPRDEPLRISADQGENSMLWVSAVQLDNNTRMVTNWGPGKCGA